MATPGGGTSKKRSEIETAWQTAQRLLDSGAYERVIEVLHAAHAAMEQTDDGVWADTLSAAVQICRACSQSRAEVTWHRSACEAADRREQELRQQLSALLDLIGASNATDGREKQERPAGSSLAIETHPFERSAPKSVEHLGLWRRVQRLLGWGNGLRPAEQQSQVKLAADPDARVTPEAEKPRIARRMPDGASTEVISVPEAAQTPPSLVVYCLGPFRVYQDDKLIADWPSLKGKAIFKYLLAHPETPIAKDILMDVFWPDADPEAARRNLHQAVYSLRQTLRGEQPDIRHIRFENDCYLLDPETNVWLDFKEFEKHVQAGRHLEAAGQHLAAIESYGIAEGLFLDDFLEEDLYEDWPSMQREQLRNMYMDITDRLTEHYVQQGEFTAAIALCRKVLAKDNCYEEAHRRLMQCYLAQGQRQLAVRQFQTCSQVLREELDISPSAATVELYKGITAGS